MTFLLAGITLNVAQVLGFIFVFLCCLGGVDPSGWRTSSSIFLLLFGGLGRRLISGRRSTRLSFVFVLGNLVAVLPIGIFFVFFD